MRLAKIWSQSWEEFKILKSDVDVRPVGVHVGFIFLISHLSAWWIWWRRRSGSSWCPPGRSRSSPAGSQCCWSGSATADRCGRPTSWRPCWIYFIILIKKNFFFVFINCLMSYFKTIFYLFDLMFDS